MSKFTRRETLARGGQAVAAAAVAMTAGVAAKAAQPDPLREGVQVLVNEIRQDRKGSVTTASFWALQEVADRLEALPGIQPLSNEFWKGWARYPAPFCRRNAGRTLRPPTMRRVS